MLDAIYGDEGGAEECRMSLYDRIFKPRRYTLSDGTVVEEKRSRAHRS